MDHLKATVSSAGDQLAACNGYLAATMLRFSPADQAEMVFRMRGVRNCCNILPFPPLAVDKPMIVSVAFDA